MGAETERGAKDDKGKKADDKAKKAPKAPSLGYNPPPKTLPGFPKASPVKGKTRMGGGKVRKRWKNDDGDILEWDETKIVYYLRWFDKEGDEYMGESLLWGVGETEVRKAFRLEPEEPPGDCLEVGKEHLAWLKDTAKGVAVQLDLFDYFVEATASPE